MNKKLLSCAVAFAAIIAISSCKKKDNGPATTSNIMFVNGCAGAPNVDATVGGSKVTGATSLQFLANSGYRQVTAGSLSMQFLLTSTQTKISEGTVATTAGNNYSVFAGGIITAPTLVYTSDDLTAPSSGHAKVRFVNLGSDNLNETYSVGSSNLDSNVLSSKVTQFREVTAGSYTVRVGDPTNLASVVSINNQELNAGKAYTILLTGTVNGSGSAALTVTMLQNN
jgi:hypothetical protein